MSFNFLANFKFLVSVVRFFASDEIYYPVYVVLGGIIKIHKCLVTFAHELIFLLGYLLCQRKYVKKDQNTICVIPSELKSGI